MSKRYTPDKTAAQAVAKVCRDKGTYAEVHIAGNDVWEVLANYGSGYDPLRPVDLVKTFETKMVEFIPEGEWQ